MTAVTMIAQASSVWTTNNMPFRTSAASFGVPQPNRARIRTPRLATLKGAKTLSELAQLYDMHAHQLNAPQPWHNDAVGGAAARSDRHLGAIPPKRFWRTGILLRFGIPPLAVV